jgi:type II secretory pathway pseudopilin PulG
MKNNNSKYIIAVIVILLLIGGGVWYYQSAEQKKKDDDQATQQKQADDNAAMMQAQQQSSTSIQNVSGTYTGQNASILSSFLVFPTSSLELTTDHNFTFDGSNLDIYPLIKPYLTDNTITKVTVSTNIIGSVADNADQKTVDFTAKALTINYFVNGSPADADTTATLTAAVAKAGLTIPVITDTSPVVLNTTLDNTDPIITIANTAQAPFTFSFTGTKN